MAHIPLIYLLTVISSEEFIEENYRIAITKSRHNQHIKKASLLPGVVYVESQSDSIIVLCFDFVQFL